MALMPLDIADLPEVLIYQHAELGIEPLPNSSSEQLQKRLGRIEQILMPLIPAALRQEKVIRFAQRRGFAHHSHAIPADQPWRSWPVCLQPVSKLSHMGVQIARCVDDQGGNGNGTQGHGSFVDEQGRVHIRYPWSGQSSLDDEVYPPIRVMQRQHGAQQSMQQMPRLGQDVLIGYLYGDIDSPYVQGCLYNGIGDGDQDTDSIYTLPDASGKAASINAKQGNSPLWHGAGTSSRINQTDHHAGALSGISSHSLDGKYRNQFMMDDSDSANAILLSHGLLNSATSQQPWYRPEQRLELGELHHRVDNHRDAKRGQGFDLYSKYGATLGAGKGLMLASYQITHTDAIHQMAFERSAALALLKQNEQTAKATGQTLQQHQRGDFTAYPLTGLQGQDVNQQMLKQQQIAKQGYSTAEVNALPQQAAMTLLNGKAGLHSAAQQHHLVSPQQHIQSGGQQLWNTTTLKLHSQQIEMTGGLGKDGQVYVGSNGDYVAMQAHGGMLHADSQQQMQLGSQGGLVNISAAKEIRIGVAGGASIVINGSGITVACPGKLLVRASKREHVTGAKMNAEKITLPQTKTDFSNKIDYLFEGNTRVILAK